MIAVAQRIQLRVLGSEGDRLDRYGTVSSKSPAPTSETRAIALAKPLRPIILESGSGHS